MNTFASRLSAWLAKDISSGILLMAAATLGFAWANSPLLASYEWLSQLSIGPAELHLELSLASWAADGLLAIFFFVVGVELKHEIVAGSLSKPREAAVPVIAAVGGMILPAVIFVAVIGVFGEPAALPGWAIPTATDIAFALAVLAIFGRGLPRELRLFLLTLAVVDDLLAIVVIAVFYTASISIGMLAAAIGAVALFAVIARSRYARWWLLIPLALIAWGLMHSSGVHATIAGVLLGLVVPARALFDEKQARTHTFERAVRPVSTAVALPVFAFFAAGVSVFSGDGIATLTQPVVIAIVLALVVGKVLGVLGITAIVTRWTPLSLPAHLALRDLVPIALLCGIGFTVSLLIAELSYSDATLMAGAKIAILVASLLAATLAAIALRVDSRKAASLR